MTRPGWNRIAAGEAGRSLVDEAILIGVVALLAAAAVTLIGICVTATLTLS